MITLYSKDNCTFCVRARNILKSRSIPFTEYKLGVDFEMDFIYENYPTMKTFPIIVDNTNGLIGGYTDLVEKISDNQHFGKRILHG